MEVHRFSGSPWPGSGLECTKSCFWCTPGQGEELPRPRGYTRMTSAPCPQASPPLPPNLGCRSLPKGNCLEEQSPSLDWGRGDDTKGYEPPTHEVLPVCVQESCLVGWKPPKAALGLVPARPERGLVCSAGHLQKLSPATESGSPERHGFGVLVTTFLRFFIGILRRQGDGVIGGRDDSTNVQPERVFS